MLPTAPANLPCCHRFIRMRLVVSILSFRLQLGEAALRAAQAPVLGPGDEELLLLQIAVVKGGVRLALPRTMLLNLDAGVQT